MKSEVHKNAHDLADLYRTKPASYNRRLKLSLPIPPSVNAIHYNTRNGGRRLTAKAQNYIRDSRAMMNMLVEDQHWHVPEKHNWMYVDLVFYFPDRRRRDSHNCLKLLLDCMESVVFKDDMYALPRIHSVEYDKENPRVEIVVSHQDESDREKASYVMG